MGDTWQQDAIVRPDVSDIGDQFGWSVGLSGNGSMLVVGARREDSGDPLDPTDNGTMSAGAAYVFSFSTAGWVQLGYLKPPTMDVGDAFGERVAISENGSTIAIGVPEEDSATNVIDGSSTDNSAPEAGAIWIFAGLPWTVQSYIKAPNADPGDAFGYRLSLTKVD